MAKSSSFTNEQLVQMFQDAIEDGEHPQWDYWYHHPEDIDSFFALKIAPDAWTWLGYVASDIAQKGSQIWKNATSFSEETFLPEAFLAWKTYQCMSKMQYYSNIAKILKQDSKLLYSEVPNDGIIRFYCLHYCNDAHSAMQLGNILHDYSLQPTEVHCILIKPLDVVNNFFGISNSAEPVPMVDATTKSYHPVIQRLRTYPSIATLIDDCIANCTALEKVPMLNDLFLMYASLQHAAIELPDLGGFEMGEQSFVLD